MRLGWRSRRRSAPLSKRALLQHVNNELWSLAGDEALLPVYCECGRDDCILSLDVSRDAFAAARAHPASAIVVAEHKAGFEPVLDRAAGFLVIADAEAGEGPPRLDADRMPDRL